MPLSICIEIVLAKAKGQTYSSIGTHLLGFILSIVAREM